MRRGMMVMCGVLESGGLTLGTGSTTNSGWPCAIDSMGLSLSFLIWKMQVIHSSRCHCEDHLCGNWNLVSSWFTESNHVSLD